MIKHLSWYLLIIFLYACRGPEIESKAENLELQERLAHGLRNHSVYEKGKIVAGALGNKVLTIPVTRPGDRGFQLTWILSLPTHTDRVFERSKQAFHLLAIDYIGDDSLQYYPNYALDFTDSLGHHWPGIAPYLFEVDLTVFPEANKMLHLPVYPLTWQKKLTTFLTAFPQDNGTGIFKDKGDSLEVVITMDSVFYESPVWLPERCARWHALIDNWVLKNVDRDFKVVRYAVNSVYNPGTSFSLAFPCYPKMRGKVVRYPGP